MNNTITAYVVCYVAGLILIGTIGFLATGAASITALIPAFFSIVVVILYFSIKAIATKKVAFWVVMALTLIGFVATVNGIPKVIMMLTGGEIERPAAAISQSIMALLSLLAGLMLYVGRRKDHSC